jgi:hypothetical protein
LAIAVATNSAGPKHGLWLAPAASAGRSLFQYRNVSFVKPRASRN